MSGVCDGGKVAAESEIPSGGISPKYPDCQPARETFQGGC